MLSILILVCVLLDSDSSLIKLICDLNLLISRFFCCVDFRFRFYLILFLKSIKQFVSSIEKNLYFCVLRIFLIRVKIFNFLFRVCDSPI